MVNLFKISVQLPERMIFNKVLGNKRMLMKTVMICFFKILRAQREMSRNQTIMNLQCGLPSIPF
jgi:hypothetical protein